MVSYRLSLQLYHEKQQINEQAEEEQHLLNEYQNSHCSSRKSCFKCLQLENAVQERKKQNEKQKESSSSSSNSDCGWCDLTQSCEDGSQKGPADWDCSNTAGTYDTGMDNNIFGIVTVTHGTSHHHPNLKTTWHFNDGSITSSSSGFCARDSNDGRVHKQKDAPRPSATELEGLDYPLVVQESVVEAYRTKKDLLQRKKKAEVDALFLYKKVKSDRIQKEQEHTKSTLT